MLDTQALNPRPWERPPPTLIINCPVTLTERRNRGQHWNGLDRNILTYLQVASNPYRRRTLVPVSTPAGTLRRNRRVPPLAKRTSRRSTWNGATTLRSMSALRFAMNLTWPLNLSLPRPMIGSRRSQARNTTMTRKISATLDYHTF